MNAEGEDDREDGRLLYTYEKVYIPFTQHDEDAGDSVICPSARVEEKKRKSSLPGLLFPNISLFIVGTFAYIEGVLSDLYFSLAMIPAWG